MKNGTEVHILDIDGMTGETCVQKVRTALSGVPSIVVDQVEIGHATIQCDDGSSCEDAIKAIDAAGYQAHEAETVSKGSGQGSANAAQASQNMVSEGGGSAAETPAGKK